MSRLALITTWSLVVGVAGGQSTFVVDAANGPGTNFVDLPAAVAAAASGDRLIVRPGNYQPFYVSGKALRISGAGPTQTLINAPHNAVLGVDYVKIEFVPAGTVFRLEGLSIQGNLPTTANLGAQLMIRGATGSVVLSDVATSPAVAGGGVGLRIEGAQVHASRSSFSGGSHAFWLIGFPFGVSPYYGSGAPGVFMTASGVLVAEHCHFTGGAGSVSNVPPLSGTATGGSALNMSDSQARIFGGHLQGGNATASGNASNVALAGRGIIVAGASTIRVGGAATATGGNSFLASGGTAFASAIEAIMPAVVEIDSSVVLATNGGAATSGSGTTPLGLPPPPLLVCDGTTLVDGALDAPQPATIALSKPGPPGAPIAVFVSAGPGFSVPYPAAMSSELLLSDLDFPAVIGTTDALGSFSFSFTAAALPPAVLDVPWHLQAAVFDAAQNRALMSNATVRVFK